MQASPSAVRPAAVDLAEASDALLADRAADGDPLAFATLMRRHGPALRAYTRRILGSSADVDDVVQETFITAWTQLVGLDDRSALKGWLIRIAGRKALDRIRARKSHDDIADHEFAAPATGAPERRAEASARRSALDAALLTLPVQQRRAWLLHEAGGLTYAEVALELELPTSTVRGLLARSRAQLIRQMEAWR